MPKNTSSQVVLLNGKPTVVQDINDQYHDTQGGADMGNFDMGHFANMPALIGQQQMQRRLGLSKWKISLLFTRLTKDIPETLFVPVFGPINKDTSYVPVLNRVNKLSAGMSITFSIRQDGNAQYSFTKAGNTDIVIVSSSTQTTYSEILNMINAGGYFTSDKIRYSADANFALQFAAGDILSTTNTLSGLISNDSAEVAANKSPDQFQNPIIDVDLNLAVDAVYTLIAPMAEDTVSFNWFFQNVMFKSPAQFTRACQQD